MIPSALHASRTGGEPTISPVKYMGSPGLSALFSDAKSELWSPRILDADHREASLFTGSVVRYCI